MQNKSDNMVVKKSAEQIAKKLLPKADNVI